MKVCPICQSSYEATVDFCFKDGAPLELQASEESHDEPAATDFTALTMEELEPPEAVSLSGLVPIATPEDDLKTLAMAAEPPPQLDEDELATVTSGVQPVAKAEGADSQGVGVSDPFTPQQTDDSSDSSSRSQPVWQLGPDGDADETADTDDRMETVQWQGEPAGVPGTSGGGGFLKGVAALASLLALLVGYQIFFGGSPDSGQPDAAVVPSQEVVEESAAPEKEGPVTDSTADAVAAGEEAAPTAEGEAEEGDAVADGSEPEVEGGQGEELEPDEDQPEAEEETSSQPSPDEAAEAEDRERRDRERLERVDRERRERRDRERLERRKKASKEERASRRAKAAEEKAARAAADSEAADKKAAERAAAADRKVAAGNPWTSGATPPAAAAPERPAADATNPWGVNTPAAAPARTTVTIKTKPAGSKVKVAGKSRGQSPVKLDLPQGTHEIEVSKEGYLPRSSYVKVRDTEPISMSIALEPVASAAAKREGTLFISSSPSGALLYVDGSSKGRTPLSVAVTEGTHSLKLVSDGREPVEKRIKVDFGRSTTVRRFIEIP